MVNILHFFLKKLFLENILPAVLKKQLNFHQDKVENIKNRILNAGIDTNNISTHLQNLADGKARKLSEESIDIAQKVSEQMRAETQRSRKIHQEIGKLKEKIAVLEPDWEIKMSMAEENISSTQTNIRYANIALGYVEEQMVKEKHKFDEWNNTMSSRLQQLRDKIAKAKHAAEGVSTVEF